MTDDERNEAISFCNFEYSRVFVEDDELKIRSVGRIGALMHNSNLAARFVSETVISCLRERRPMSLIRVGNGEGTALSMTGGTIHPLQRKAFYLEFHSQNGRSVPITDVVPFCLNVQKAIDGADFMGVRSFFMNEKINIENAIARADLCSALGIIYARHDLQNRVADGSLAAKTLLSAWIYLELLGFLDAMMSAAESVVVISGRHGLADAFASRLRSRLKDFISVPVQGSSPATASQSHFYKTFPVVQSYLGQDLRGVLVLVGAGLFGKIYCQTARDHGGVAIDLGSGFDILAGLKTRQVHGKMDLADRAWI